MPTQRTGTVASTLRSGEGNMFSSTMIKFALAAVCGVMAIGWSVPVDAKVAHCDDCGQVACDCCPAPCISYHHHRTLRRTCCGCCDPSTRSWRSPTPCAARPSKCLFAFPAAVMAFPRFAPVEGCWDAAWWSTSGAVVIASKSYLRKCGDIVVHSMAARFSGHPAE